MPLENTAPSPAPTSVPSQRTSRRALLRGAAWAAPVAVVASSAPAFADSTFRYGIIFDGGSGANGTSNGSTIRFGVAPSSVPVTLDQALTITFSIVDINTQNRAARGYSLATPTVGTQAKGTYTAATGTTVNTWVIPAGTRLPVVTATGGPGLLVRFEDGLQGVRRLESKIVITGISGSPGNPDAGKVIYPTELPIDSSVVRDADPKALSPDGIY